MSSSPENGHHPENALAVKAVGATSCHRQSVRRHEVSGVQEQGRTSYGIPWNTGSPSHAPGISPETGCHRATTPSVFAVGDGSGHDRTVHRHPGIGHARQQTERRPEVSGSLSALIVMIESWRTHVGEEPVSNKGGHPETGISAWNHALNPQRR
jgi:hypothetical protein